MNMQDLLDWCDQMIEKYAIEDADVVALQEILNGVNEEELYGDEYTEEPIEE